MYKISVIITTYNSEKYINKCIDSLIRQEYNEMEIVIIDDGSTDNTKEIIKSYLNKYKNIKYFYKENKGVADSRNYGIEKATGDYIMFLDSDDYIKENLFNSLEQYMEKDIEMIKFKLVRVNEKDEEIFKVDGPIFDILSGEEAFNLLYSKDTLLDSPCIYLMKKDIFLKKKFLVGTYHEDFGLIPLLVVKARSIVSVDIYGYCYVQTDSSITRNEDYSKTIRKAKDALIHYDNMLNELENLKIEKVTKENLKIYYTNAILLKNYELKNEDREKYIQEIKLRKMYNNIKVRNVKQFIKRVLLRVSIKKYLELK